MDTLAENIFAQNIYFKMGFQHKALMLIKPIGKGRELSLD